MNLASVETEESEKMIERSRISPCCQVYESVSQFYRSWNLGKVGKDKRSVQALVLLFGTIARRKTGSKQQYAELSVEKPYGETRWDSVLKGLRVGSAVKHRVCA